MRVPAFAKINLALEVGPPRADGYHDLVTLFQTIDLADELELEPDEPGCFTLVVDGAAPAGEDNLVLRAARSLAAGSGQRVGARLRLRKRIPMGGGLGGGSSDAAAALIGLDRLWRTAATPDDLFRLALGLGSDVPFFLLGGTALGLGRGEKLVPVAELPEHAVVLVLPGVAVSTARAFSELDAIRGAAGVRSSDGWRWPRLWSWSPGVWDDLGNDFELSVFESHPELRGHRDRLAELGADHARMTGSGSVVYGLFSDGARARSAAAALERSGFSLYLGTTLTRARREAETTWP